MHRLAALLTCLLIAGTAAETAVARTFPSSRDTGVPRGQKLRPYRGPCTITRDHAVISGRRVTCDLNIRASGVVISRSKLYGSVSSGDDEDSGYSFTLPALDGECLSGRCARGHRGR